MSSKSHTEEGFCKEVEEEIRKTHHDNQENILEVLPMSKSVGDEKGKVSLQKL